MDNEEEDRGDVSAFDPFKGYSIIDTFLDNLDTYADVYDDGNAESGPSVSRSLSTRGLKKAIKDTCDEYSLSPRDLLNLVRRTTYKTAAWPPEEMGRHDDLKGMLRWLSDTIRSIERAELRQELSFYENVEEEEGEGDISAFDFPKERAIAIANSFMKNAKQFGVEPWVVDVVCQGEGITRDTLYQCLTRAGKHKLISRIKRQFRESVEEDEGDVSDFPEPKTNPIIAHCGICGAPIGANGPIIDIPADYDPDDYPRDDICDDCLRQQEHHYVTHEMALDAGDPDLEGTEW